MATCSDPKISSLFLIYPRCRTTGSPNQVAVCHVMATSLDDAHVGSCEDPRCLRQTSTTWYCVDCACSLCEECWPFNLPHLGGRTGRDGLPHEQTTYQIYKKLEHILNPPTDAEELEELHHRDLDSTWFGTNLSKSAGSTADDYVQ